MSDSIGGISMDEIIAAARNGLDDNNEPAQGQNVDVFSNSNYNNAAAPAPVYCQNCGAEMHPDERFCSICGCPAANNNIADASVPANDVKICPNCGAVAQPDEMFCANCGFAFNNIAEPQQFSALSCPNCGAEIGADERFCQVCGCPVNDGQSQYGPSNSAADVCPNCGMEIIPGSMFCENCGFSLGGAVQQAPQQFGGQLVCPGCGTAIEPGQKFCEGCGRSVDTMF